MSNRLGEPEKALHHYEHSGLNANTKEIANAEALKTHLNECSKATELGDWNSLLKESRSAVVFGADSAPQVNSITTSLHTLPFHVIAPQVTNNLVLTLFHEDQCYASSCLVEAT